MILPRTHIHQHQAMIGCKFVAYFVRLSIIHGKKKCTEILHSFPARYSIFYLQFVQSPESTGHCASTRKQHLAQNHSLRRSENKDSHEFEQQLAVAEVE